MGKAADKFVVTLGLVALAHATYSAAQHRVYLRLSEQDFTSLPADVLIQTLVGLIIACYGIVRVVGAFKEIRVAADTENRTWDAINSRSAFYCFNHRGNVTLCNSFTSGDE